MQSAKTASGQFLWTVFVLCFYSFPAWAIELVCFSQHENTLYSVQTPLTSPVRIGSPDIGPNDAVELVEASPQRLYAFDRMSNVLITLDRFTGQVVAKVPLDRDIPIRPRGWDLSPDGLLYGIFSGIELRTIDPLTGTSPFVVKLSETAAQIESIAFAPDGMLYASGSIANDGNSESLFRLSTMTGDVSLIGKMGGDVDELTFGSDGFLYGVNSQDTVETHLLKIDPATASVEDVGNTGITGITGIVAIRASDGGIDVGLAAHYVFNGDTKDTAGTNDGVLVGSATFTDAINGKALEVQQEDGYVRIPPSSAINLATPFRTISVWFKAGPQRHSEAEILDKTASSDYDLSLLTNSNPSIAELRFRAYDGTNFNAISGLISPGEWINAVILKNASNILVYTNSSLMGTMTISSVLTKTNSLIVGAGGSPYRSGYGFVGQIEDLRFYARALTNDEIQALYFWSYPRLSISRDSRPGQIEISWNTIFGRAYQLQYKSGIETDSNTWVDLGNASAATSAEMSVSQTVDPASRLRLYRTVLLP
jgi:hypothetical protein